MEHIIADAPSAHNASCAVERVSLNRVSRLYGFADVRLAGVHLRGLRVEECAGGRLSVSPPLIPYGRGRTIPAFALQPGAREAIEGAIAAKWAQSGAAR